VLCWFVILLLGFGVSSRFIILAADEILYICGTDVASKEGGVGILHCLTSLQCCSLLCLVFVLSSGVRMRVKG
jgi:hypothetical protein